MRPAVQERLPKRTEQWTCPNGCADLKVTSDPGNAAVDIVRLARNWHAKAGCPNEPPPAPLPEPGMGRKGLKVRIAGKSC